MNKLRKIVSIFLAVSMLICSSIVFADDQATQTTGTDTFSDVAKGTKTEEAVTKLVTYGVISGYPDGTFKPEGQITRAEFAAVISRFKGLDNTLKEDTVTGFSDLDKDEQAAWSRQYVKAAVDLKIINGFPDGTFRAQEPVTYEQAVKMIICAIGYEPVAQSEYNKIKITNPDTVTWSSGYISAANKNKITLNAMVGDVTQPATRAIVAILVSNAYDAPKINVVTDKNGNVSYEKGEGTVADDISDSVEVIEGLVSGTYYTGLDSQDKNLQESEIILTNSDGDQKYEMSDALKSKVNLIDLIGKKVKLYYSKSDDQVTKYTETTQNKTTRIDEQDIIIPFSANSIKYYDANDKTQTLNVNGYKFIYNGKYMPSMNLESLNTTQTPFRNGYIEVLTSQNIVKVTSFDVFVANSFDKKDENRKIFFRYGKKYGDLDYYQFPARDSDKPEIYVATSGSTKYTKTEYDSLSITAYDIINLLESPKDAQGNSFKQMYITKGSKTGKVTSKSSEEREVEFNNSILYLTNDFNEYNNEVTTDKKEDFELDGSYTYYLDYMGQVAAVKFNAVTTGTYKYGYVMAVGKDGSDYKIRIYTTSGTSSDFTAKDTLTIDGKKVKASNMQETLEDTAREANKGYNDGVTGYYQPIRYSTSGSYIDVIDTVVEGEGGAKDKFKCNVSLEKGASTGSGANLKQGDYSYKAQSSTVVMYIPDDRTKTAKYSKMSYSTAFVGTKEKYVEAFDIEESTSGNVSPFMILYGQDPSLIYAYNSPCMIVTSVDEGTNTVLKGYLKGSTEETKVTISDDFDKNVDKSNWTANDVSKGDIIMFLKNASGEVISIKPIYDADNPTQKQSVDNITNAKKTRCVNVTKGDGNYIYFNYGTVVEKNVDDKKITLSYLIKEDSKTNDEIKDTANIKTFVTSSAKIYEISNKNEVTVLETIDSVNDLSTETPNKVIIVTTGMSATEPSASVVYVINN